MSLGRAYILVSGFVQGVGYRFFVEDQAAQLNLKGFVRNKSQAGVEVEVEGEKANLEQLIELLKIGPSAAHIQEVQVSWKQYRNEFSDFRIKY